MLKKWFPQMENFSGQLKKYKVTINDLLAENEKLEVRAKGQRKRQDERHAWNGRSWKANCTICSGWLTVSRRRFWRN